MSIRIRENGKERVVTLKEFEEKIKPEWKAKMYDEWRRKMKCIKCGKEIEPGDEVKINDKIYCFDCSYKYYEKRALIVVIMVIIFVFFVTILIGLLLKGLFT